MNTQEPAFPNWSENHYTEQRPRGGMSLRDYFAAAALPAEIARWADGHPKGYEGIAAIAYKAADAMLAARERA